MESINQISDHFIPFSQCQFVKFNNTGAQMLDSLSYVEITF